MWSNFSYISLFHSLPTPPPLPTSCPTVPFFQCLPCRSFFVKNFYYFLVSHTFLYFFFSFLRRTLYNTWKNHYTKFQVSIIFNKKAPVSISCISDSNNPPRNLCIVLYQKLLLMNVSETVCRLVLVLLWFRIIGKTIKTHAFHNTHLLDLSSRGVLSPSRHLRCTFCRWLLKQNSPF